MSGQQPKRDRSGSAIQRNVIIDGLDIDMGVASAHSGSPQASLFTDTSTYASDVATVKTSLDYRRVDPDALQRLRSTISADVFMNRILHDDDIDDEDNNILEIYRNAAVLNSRYTLSNIPYGLKEAIFGPPSQLNQYAIVPSSFIDDLRDNLDAIDAACNNAVDITMASVYISDGKPVEITIKIEELTKRVSEMSSKLIEANRSFQATSLELGRTKATLAEKLRAITGFEQLVVKSSEDTTLVEDAKRFYTELVGLLGIQENLDYQTTLEEVRRIIAEYRTIQEKQESIMTYVPQYLLDGRRTSSKRRRPNSDGLPQGAPHKDGEKYLGPAPRRVRYGRSKF